MLLFGESMERSRDIYERIVAQGKQSIEDFIIQRKSEELFLDFKRSSNNGIDQRLSDNDRNNLAKAISGFGNSEGGVIVWGVDCSKDKDGADVAKCEVMLNNPVRFASLLQGAISGCTIPPHSTVENHVIQVDFEKGFVVCGKTCRFGALHLFNLPRFRLAWAFQRAGHAPFWD